MLNKEMLFIPQDRQPETTSIATISTLSDLQGKMVPTVDGACFFRIYLRHPYSGETGSVVYFTGEDFSKICEEVGVNKSKVFIYTDELEESGNMSEKSYLGTIIGTSQDLLSV